jgi:hypothetical protein
MWILLAAVLLVAVVVVAAMPRTRARWSARPRAWDRASAPPRRCLQCQGTGWLNRGPERTLNVAGEGFEDRHTPATMCPACGGMGIAPER